MAGRNGMKIAMVGTKGIPAKWGGIEKYIEETGKRLVTRGHHVTVFASKWYCRDYAEKEYLGIKIMKIPTLHHQATDAISNAFFAAIMIILGRYDIVHFHGYASYYFVPLFRILNKKTVITSHGLVDSKWNNPKYSGFGREIIRYGGICGIKTAHSVTTVAEFWKKRIREEYNINARVFPSGIDSASPKPADLIKQKYKLFGNDFFLFLGRIDPIKRVDLLLSHSGIITEKYKLVIAGGAQDAFTEKYFAALKSGYQHNPKIIFTGPVHGAEKEELLSGCRIFVTPSGSEGLPIALLEAMSYGRCSLASDIPAHHEVIENHETGYLFDLNDQNEFRNSLKKTVLLEDTLIEMIGKKAKNDAEKKFNWDKTTDMIESNYRRLLDDSA